MSVTDSTDQDTSYYVLLSTDEDCVDLDTVGVVSYPGAILQRKQLNLNKTQVFIDTSITFHRLTFANC